MMFIYLDAVSFGKTAPVRAFAAAIKEKLLTKKCTSKEMVNQAILEGKYK